MSLPLLECSALLFTGYKLRESGLLRKSDGEVGQHQLFRAWISLKQPLSFNFPDLPFTHRRLLPSWPPTLPYRP